MAQWLSARVLLRCPQHRQTEEVRTKEQQLQEKREQVLQVKSEVDRVTGELAEETRTVQRLQTQLQAAMVLTPSSIA